MLPGSGDGYCEKSPISMNGVADFLCSICLLGNVAAGIGRTTAEMCLTASGVILGFCLIVLLGASLMMLGNHICLFLRLWAPRC